MHGHLACIGATQKRRVPCSSRPWKSAFQLRRARREVVAAVTAASGLTSRSAPGSAAAAYNICPHTGTPPRSPLRGDWVAPAALAWAARATLVLGAPPRSVLYHRPRRNHPARDPRLFCFNFWRRVFHLHAIDARACGASSIAAAPVVYICELTCAAAHGWGPFYRL